jgi:DNA-binding NarL/FixJ family response regulator
MVSLADDTGMAMTMTRTQTPDLAILDMEPLGDQALRLLQQIRGQQPGCRCIVLARDALQSQQAESAGADAALIKAFPAARLYEIVRQLLAECASGADRLADH